ncbi:hypothetical protein HCA58_03695 [Micromonospora sp. HNM0581]|uniref:hypothetical protein n=1 Tax=Micromonospora sp. HNM0581 TaxID=2716341 RepID=UPI00146C0CEE|nr:hypothetical protein [Micromonospora sp. HNM0581]NLU77512.1 hypothetical protein [Micromonospora sp. HNM0581]
MIVVSLALILVAVVLLIFGLAGGSSLLLVVSIGASLLAAVALVAGARQAAGRTSSASGTPDGQGRLVGDRREPGIPTQQNPADVDRGDAGWRQPPGSQVAGTGDPSGVAYGYDDEPAAEDTSAEQVILVARLTDEVRVVDGRPRYHLDECPHLVGREHEPVPVGEAVELGFTPCAHCTPATVLLAQAERR